MPQLKDFVIALAVCLFYIPRMQEPFSDHSRLVILLLCWFLGVFGIHRFFVGKIGTGILMLFTLGGFGLWWLWDLFTILSGKFTDAEKRVVFRWFEPGSI